MKKRKSFITNMILALLCASILIPAASLVVWVFTERWALSLIHISHLLPEILGCDEKPDIGKSMVNRMLTKFW